MQNIVRIHRPTLTDEERARRMEQIKAAAVRLLLAAERAKKEKEHESGIG